MSQLPLGHILLAKERGGGAPLDAGADAQGMLQHTHGKHIRRAGLGALKAKRNMRHGTRSVNARLAVALGCDAQIRYRWCGPMTTGLGGARRR